MKSTEFMPNKNTVSIFESINGRDSYFLTWEKEIHPVLCEVALRPEQIQQLFKNVETGAGRSGLGKAFDVVKGASEKISDVWFNKFGGMLQSSGPVQAFDQKWEDIKSKIAAKNPELANKLAKYGEFAKNNPKLHKFLLAIAGSAAAALGIAAAGGVGAGALAVGTGAGVATGILNIADRLLQGQKASTAIGRGATTGAIAGLTAGAAAKIAGAISNTFKAEYLQVKGSNNIMKGTFNLNGQWTFVTGKAADVQAASQAASQGNYQLFYSLVEKMRQPEYLKSLDASREVIKQAAAHYQDTVNTMKTLAQVATAAAGGASSAGTSQQPPVKESLNRQQINELFGITGNKVDASTLEKAWKKAGSPTDSDEITKILQNAGVKPEVIQAALSNLNIPAAAAAQPRGAASAEPTTPAANPAGGTTAPSTAAPAATAPAADSPTAAPAAATPTKPGVNPELQKRLAARKAGKPMYAGNLEEEQTDEGQIYSTGGGAGQSYRKFRPKTDEKIVNANDGNGWRWYEPKLDEEQVDELKCWSGYTRVKGVPAGAPGSCKKKTKESSIMKGIQNEGR